MSRLDANLALARKAIQYVNGLRITSTNVPHRIGSYKKSPLSVMDRFIMDAMRVDLSRPAPYLRERRKMLLDVLRDPKLSAGQKKDKVRTFMAYWGKDYFTTGRTWQFMTLHPDETRVRSARKAIKFRHGNCMEKSAIVATWLHENAPPGRHLWWCAAGTWDHGFCVFDAGSPTFSPVIPTWSEDAVLVDGWTGDWYRAKHPADLRKGNHLPNPFQVHIRRKLSNSSGQIRLAEVVQNGDSAFAPGFTLRSVEQPGATPPGDGITLADVRVIADDVAAVEAELAEAC